MWLFLQSVPHNPSDSVYVVSGLVQLYKEVLKQTPNEASLTWKNLIRLIFQIYADKEVKALEPSLYSSSKEGPKIYGFSICTPGRFRLSSRYVDRQRHGRYIHKIVYAPDVDLLFVVDDHATAVKVYKTTSVYVKTLQVYEQRRHTVITDIAWSYKEQRLGVAMQDNTLQFFDFCDNFSFVHILSNSGKMALQHSIWYISVWISSDMRFTMNEWDILTEEFFTWPKAHTAQITQLLELGGDLVASAALDRKVMLWSLTWKEVVMQLSFDKINVHTLAFCSEFDMLLAAGYEQVVHIYVFDSSRDCSKRGQLIGHSHSINALEIMKESPLAVTTDDRSYLKVWDLRMLDCVQSISLEGYFLSQADCD